MIPRHLLDVTRWPTLVVFAVAGSMLVAFAFTTLSLFTLTMANLRLLTEFGWMAAIDGGLLQLALLIAKGAAALFFYLLYKICEGDLIGRYYRWIGKDQDRRP